MDNLKERLEKIQKKIKDAALSCGRSSKSIRLVAVSKTVPGERVKEAIKAGAKILGENYIQESREKIEMLSSFPVSWHFIGHLQSNKAKYAVKLFDLIHSVDSIKLAKALNKEAKKQNKVQKILIQVNISKENTKSGIEEEQALELIRQISQFSNLSINGLMTMPPYFNEPEKVRPYFKALTLLRDRINQAGMANLSMDELSMGMSGDFETAIEEGSTLVRVGTAIFGKRT
ncbi:Pyridoxal phosphate homeostasis protein [Candidatus Magnetomoraceae bacterium gMMP-15]